MPDSSEIDAALIAMLRADATLMALVPDGVYMEQALPNSKRYVVATLVIADDVSVFGKRGIEDIVYQVKAVMLESINGNIKAAAARIDELLESNTTLVAAGYTTMACHREERVRYVEVDPVDATLRWQHRGGRYRVQMSVN